mgnify:CR=1 FL=1
MSSYSFLIALDMSTASYGGIFQPLIAVFATTISVALGMEKLTWSKALGVLLASAGVLLIVGGPVWFGDSGGGSLSIAAVLLYIVNTLSLAVSGVLLRKMHMLSPHPPICVALLGFVGASPLLLLTSAFFSSPAPVQAWPASVWLAQIGRAHV